MKCIVILNGGWNRLFASTTGAGLRTFVRSPNGRTRDRVFVRVVTCRERPSPKNRLKALFGGRPQWTLTGHRLSNQITTN